MADDMTGLKQVVDEAREQRVADWKTGENRGDQLPLLPAIRDEVEIVDIGDQDLPHSGGAGKKGPGRPQGSKNRRTVEFIEYLKKLGYSDPLRGLAEVWSRPIEVLAAELGCSKLEAFDRQVDAMKAAMPFWHQKMPQAVVIDETASMTLITVDSTEMLAMLRNRPDDDPLRQRGVEILAPLLEGTDAEATKPSDEGAD